MPRKSIVSSFVLAFLLSACVTINIYFPAAAAEDAARVIVRDVLDEGETSEPATNEEQTSYLTEDSTSINLLSSIVNFLIPPAYAAEADININTPAITALRASMKARAASLKPYYTNGAVGLTTNANVKVRDLSAIPLKDRNKVKKLVADENKERAALYAEIARANNHPEWEADIRATFARVWVEEVAIGTWHQSADGSWKQKK